MTEPDAIQSAQVEHNPTAQQFELHVGSMLCLLQYRLRDGKMIVYHTEVPPAMQNRGLAERMTKVALEYARAENLKVEPRCPYTAAFLRRHREYSDLLS
jgi:predicted GNAT family acetyltransferase